MRSKWVISVELGEGGMSVDRKQCLLHDFGIRPSKVESRSLPGGTCHSLWTFVWAHGARGC